MRVPSNPVPLQSPGRGLEVVIAESVDRWMQMLERNQGTWLAAIGAGGLGRDPEAEAIIDEARERAADRLIEALQTYEAAQAPLGAAGGRPLPTPASPRPRASSGSSAAASPASRRRCCWSRASSASCATCSRPCRGQPSSAEEAVR